MSIITRFAPSPTGLLHVGNARTALINFLLTKKLGGQFLLRIDDTDIIRSTKESEDAIKKDLNWLKINWDNFARQSERFARYDELKDYLIKKGRIYACYESPEELEIKRKMQLSRGKPPIYDRGSLNLTIAKIKEYEDEGKKPHYRFLLQNDTISWDDLVRGEIKFEAQNLSDPIVIREDGSLTYMLCSVIDDIDFNISHIVRGEDHITNTAIQIQMFEALGAIPPKLAHLALITAKNAEISKRIGGFDITSLRGGGIEAMAINSFFAKLGSADNMEPYSDMEQLIENFDITKFSKSPANYDRNDLARMNHKIIQLYSFASIQSRLEELNVKNITQSFWDTVKPNINNILELKQWWDICNNPITPIIEDQDLLNEAINLLPKGKWDNNTWIMWTNEIKAQTSKAGKNLFMPIRKALTGQEHGPELKNLLPLIGREKVISRLKGDIS